VLLTRRPAEGGSIDWCLLREEIKRKVALFPPCSQKVAEVVNTLIDTLRCRIMRPKILAAIRLFFTFHLTSLRLHPACSFFFFLLRVLLLTS
jgi:hypothetical protein